ncbi:signal transduction histidine kinase/CheY-like chemotaxis protein [Inhella inkyongensis]|uniref:histidine kinase n=1 Tax=Inhella inkyongensis TaxID=392593 RepID=A0A840S5W2_9BURK|nr:hybrid sensor histidine kinase/response regulator [Inhella inkyongensis]MBB5205795.1 signal transduction histidine kinase/CheY-like chemotaxis protein [Inhella inkyongensis]
MTVRQSEREPEFLQALQDERIRLSLLQNRRMRWAHTLANGATAWLAYQAGAHEAAWTLGLATLLLAHGRAALLQWLHDHGRRAALLQALTWSPAVVSLSQAALLIAVFQQPFSLWQTLITMVMFGNAAGGVAPAAGHLPGYLAWCAPIAGALVLSWLQRGGLESWIFALLILVLFALLIQAVAEQARLQRDMVRLGSDLRRAKEGAERASEAKTRFFAAASHDLRQPLAALTYQIATVQALAGVHKDERLAQTAAGLRRSLQDSRSLLDSLLEVSQLEAGAVAAHPEPVDLHALLQHQHELLAPLARERGLLWELQLPPGPARWAHTDPALLRRVLSNLLSNAIKFTPQGWVRLALIDHEGLAQIVVQDSGPGIPADLQERVFEEFFQVGNAARDRTQGLGLGLAIVRRLVKLLDLELQLESQPAQGCRFSLSLALQAAPPAAAAAAPPLGRHRLLVVDDEVPIRDALAQWLGLLGWSVRTAADCPEALAQLSPLWQPDALVLDLRLRAGATGLDVLNALRASGCQAPAWLVTGETDPEPLRQAREAGMTVLHKPVDGLELAGQISERLRQPLQNSRT